MSAVCLIPSNPDISGIGVRIAIYLQNLLCFVPALWALWDGEVSDYELESAETHSTTNLVLAFAILISCIVQALTVGLTNYHASIVLSLSWMNNTNAFIYFLLYVQYRSQGANKLLSRSDWRRHIKAQAKTVLFLPDALRRLIGRRLGRGPYLATNNRKGLHAGKEAVRVLFKRIALLLGSLHLTVMAALGIWLWSSPQSFGAPEAAACVTQNADIAVLGAHVLFGSEVLRIVSLVIYSLFLVPGVNLLLPMSLFLAHHCWYHAPRTTEPVLPLHRSTNTEASPPSNPSPDTAASSSQVVAPESSGQAPRSSPSKDDPDARARLCKVLPVFVGLGFLLVVNVIFITDIELTLRRNAHLQAAGESEWGFGQILALLLVFMPLRDLVEALVRRRQEMQTKLDTALAKAIIEKDLTEVSRWILAGASPRVKADNNMTAWEVFITHPDASKNTGLIPALHEAKVDFKQTLSDGRTALAKLIAEKSWDLIRIISEVDHAFADGLSELQLAVFHHDWDSARTFVEFGADVNAAFPDPLQDVESQTLLQLTCEHSERVAPISFTRLLLEKGADPNAGGGDGVSDLALRKACLTGKADVVQLLLDNQADATLKDSLGNTVLHDACLKGEYGVVEILLRHGVNINAWNFFGGTALHLACERGHANIVQLLLDNQADATLKYWQGKTAPELARQQDDYNIIKVFRRHGVEV